MDPKTPNFSAYDFLGYFFPGALAVLLADASIAYHTASNGFSYELLLQRYASRDLGIALPFVIVSYIVGHFLSFVSSISLERYAVWNYGHPSKYLLKMDTGGYFAVVGANKWLSKILRGVMWAFLLPISLLDLVFGTMLRLRANYVTPLDPLLRAAVWRSLNAIVNQCSVENPSQHGKPKDHEFWKLAVHYAVAGSPNHTATLRNYVVLYGFLRTTALVFVMTFWGIAAHAVVLNGGVWKSAVLLAVSAVVCFAAFASFVKFFQRYHEEALFAVTITLARENKMKAAA